MRQAAIPIGASTANLYPALTETALDELLKAGIRRLEIFVNSECETEPAYAGELRRRAEACGARIVSLHPYTSGSEPYWLFSEYRRRFDEGLRYFAKLFRAAQIMGARYVILHGDRDGGPLSEEDSIRRFGELAAAGEAYGVELLQENVVRFRSCRPAYLRRMTELLGDRARFVFDLKQCMRCGLRPAEVLDAMGRGLRHVHISDFDDAGGCLPPGRGKADYRQLADGMRAAGFSGDWIIELYRENFKYIDDLANSVKFLEKTTVL